MASYNGEQVEAMRLHEQPPRVTRLSRRVLAGLGLVTGLGLGGALIYALQTRDQMKSNEELYSTEHRATAEGLANMPKDYTGPVLGPKLPGDLGRPILEAQKRNLPTGQNPDPDKQRRAQETEAARTAKLFGVIGTATPPDKAETAAGQFVVPELAGLTPQIPASRDRRTAFLDAPPDRRTVAPDRVMPPASPNVVQAGTVIPAALITGIRSDLPGQITAQVTENVRDSPTGGILLIPQGARLIGQYDSSVAFGQRRVLLVWTRIIMPNGKSIVLERQPGTDVEGYAGLEDGVDYHWWDLFKAAALSTLLSVGTELAADNDDRLIRALRDGAQNTVNDAGQQIIRRQLTIAPTLTIRPGFPVRVMVTRDLILEPYGE